MYNNSEEIEINTSQTSQIITIYANPCYGDQCWWMWWGERGTSRYKISITLLSSKTLDGSRAASLPKICPKLHESEIEPINIDINSALDWGPSPRYIPSSDLIIEKCRTQLTPIQAGEKKKKKMCAGSGERRVGA